MLTRHPLSAIFPNMPNIDQAALTDDIRLNGQRDPITIYDGQVLDGWHRYQSCVQLKIEPLSAELAADVEPIAFVISRNMHRRHLTSSQRAAAVVACSEWAIVGRPNSKIHNTAPGAVLCNITQLAEKSEVSTKTVQQTNPDGTAVVSTISEMAKQADVSERTIQQAKAAQTAGLGDKVISGELSAKQAAAMARPPKPVKTGIGEPCAPVPTETVTISREVYDEMQELLDVYRSEAEALAETLDATDPEDKLIMAMKQIQMLSAQVATLRSRLNGETNKNNELVRTIKSKARTISKQQQEINEYKLAEAER